MTFQESITKCFSNYANFKGRASRSEYWWFYLFVLIIDKVFTLSNSLTFSNDVAEIASLWGSLIFLPPLLAASVRRLHDRNKSGWWLLIAFTIIGLIPLIYWLGKEGFKNVNEYGDPIDLDKKTATKLE
ncbi:DUF805 domain-containing protein [Porticoccaceae bacterium]|nr:DUF805 domain-containing protein [Porticoccaceae bacterium]